MQSGGREEKDDVVRTYEPTVNSARQRRDETPDTVHSRTPPRGDRYPRRWGMPWRRIFE